MGPCGRALASPVSINNVKYMCEEVFSLHCMCKQWLSSFICIQLNPLCQPGGVQFKFVFGWRISYLIPWSALGEEGGGGGGGGRGGSSGAYN